ncbi:alpha/beta fold hydrolase [Sphingopyxis kveilinensis]|uniref:alpha/beta fold hydrolase n=1 Tax=Sphingopyxis kveilinensis TaxID=3114367 RepID=UPI0030D06AAF
MGAALPIDRRKFLAGGAAAGMITLSPLSAREAVTSQWADIGGHKLHYVAAGSGPLVILIHGWADTHRTWERQLPVLAAAGFRAVAVDLPGCGLSSAGSVSPLDPPALIAALIGSTGYSEAAVIGHNLGGEIARELALRYSDQVSKLALIGSVPVAWAGDDAFLAHVRSESFAAKANADSAWGVAFFQHHLDTVHDRADVISRSLRPGEVSAMPHRNVGAHAQHCYQSYGRTGFASLRLMASRVADGSEAKVAALPQPVMVMLGEFCPLNIFSHPGAVGEDAPRLDSWHVVAGANHYVHRQKPGPVNQAIVGFLRS